MFTPSGQPQGTASSEAPANSIHGGNSASSGVGEVTKISSGNQEPVNGTTPVGLNNVVAGLGGTSTVSSSVAGQSLDLNMLLSKSQNSNNASTVGSNAGADLLASLQSSYSNSHPVDNSSQGLPQRQKVQRPRGPTSKVCFYAISFDNRSNRNFGKANSYASVEMLH